MGLGLGLLVGGMVHLWQNQQRVQLDLQQERQWRMLERLRSLETPAAPWRRTPRRRRSRHRHPDTATPSTPTGSRRADGEAEVHPPAIGS